jgi:arginine-tRNA-protein transferase
VTATVGRPEATTEKHAVYQRYLEKRHDGEMTGSWEEFEGFLHAGPPFTREVVFRIGERLLGAGIVDVEPQAVSAVYFYFDPELSGRSPGTFNVLWLVEECRRRGVPWLYLGYHVVGGLGMAYKTDYRPHQILGEDGRWR